MIKPLRTLVVIADGEHARWVEQSPRGAGFVTISDRRAPGRSAGHPVGVVVEGSSRSTTGDPSLAGRKQHEAFGREIADALNSEAAAGEFERLALVAPARMQQSIVGHLTGAAKAALIGSLDKDLTKTPDHDLTGWLTPLLFG